MKKHDNKRNSVLQQGIGYFILCVIGILGFKVFSLPSKEQQAEKTREMEEIIKAAIPPTIVEMEGIDWVEYNRNKIYIGMNVVPSDLKPMIEAWAIQANKALEQHPLAGVHVFAVYNAPKGWRPGDSPHKCYRITTARDGMIKQVTTACDGVTK